MATWKKVIVSGSNAELAKLNTGANQQINTDPTQTFLTGSFSGSFTGDGSNLTGIKATTINTVGLITDIIDGSSFFVVSQSNGLQRFPYSWLIQDLAGTNLVGESNDSLGLKPDITLTSVTASFKGDGSGLTNLPAQNTANALTQGVGINTFSFNGSAAGVTVAIKTGSVFADNVILKWDSDASQFQSSSLTDDQTNNTITGLANTSIQLTGTNSKLTGSFTGSFIGDGSGLTGVGVTITSNTAGNILFGAGSNTVISGSAKLSYDQTAEVLTVTDTIKFSGSAANTTAEFTSFASITTASIFAAVGSSPNIVNIGNPTSTTFIGNDLIINGDLIANGTSSFINTQNLLVADRFITLASSSTPSTTDGGIIIQNSLSPAGTGSGFAFYLETATNAPRWSVTSSLNLNATGGTPDEYMVTAKINSGAPSGNPTWGGTDGKGNMYINTDDQSIWIYS